MSSCLRRLAGKAKRLTALLNSFASTLPMIAPVATIEFIVFFVQVYPPPACLIVFFVQVY